MPRHHLERRGARLVVRTEERAERVEIVAGDDGSVRRQPVDQLGVAVIDNVEHVEILREPTDMPRVIPQPVDQSIDREHRTARLPIHDSCTAHEGRHHGRDVDRS